VPESHWLPGPEGWSPPGSTPDNAIVLA
jgi:hypothetical protein